MKKTVLFLFLALVITVNCVEIKKCSFDEKNFLERLVKKSNATAVVEVGEDLRSITLSFLNLLPVGSKLYCVSSMNDKCQKILFNYAAKVKIQVDFMNFAYVQAAYKLIYADLIYIKFLEKDNVYDVLGKWYKRLIGNGILCGTNWFEQKVSAEVKRFATDNQVDLFIENDFWWFAPKKSVLLLPFVFLETPHYTEEAVRFLDRFLEDHPGANVLEFGSGSSTLWLASKNLRLTMVDNEFDWYNIIVHKLEEMRLVDKVKCFLRPLFNYEICDTFDDNSFDLILIDGRNRKKCVEHSLRLLKPGGVILLNNSERYYYQGVAPLLKDWQTVVTEQNTSDGDSYYYPGFRTSWWYKP